MGRLITLLVFILISGTCVVVSADDIDQDEALKLKQSGAIMPLETILNKAKILHDGKILEAELKRKTDFYIYEIEIIDASGQVWEMKFDAQTAKLLTHEQEDGH